MIKWISTLFKMNKTHKSNELYGLDNLDDDVIGYPPDPKGIPVVQPKVLLDRMMKDIRLIRTEIGLSNQDFDKFVLPVMINFIEFVDLLPASEFKHHATGGGLVYHSFDVAKRAMRAAQHTQFPVGKSITDTQRSFTHWKVGTVIAALLHDAGKVITDMSITNGEQKKENIINWNAHDKLNVWEWAKNNKIERYYISWTPNRHNKHKNATVNIIQRIVPNETWTWLTSCLDGQNIYTAMLSSVSNESFNHPMSDIISECDSASVRDDMLNKNSHITKEMKRIPLSVLLSDLIKHRILIKDWEINHKGAPIWYVDECLYITWETCAEDLVEELKDAGYVIPELPITLARIMIEEGIAIGDEEEPYYSLSPEILGDPKKPVKLTVLKFRNPSRFINDLSKLYSIKEHKKATDQKEKHKQAIQEEKRLEAQSSIKTSEIKKQKQFESSIETISRILPFMKNKQHSNSATTSVESEEQNSYESYTEYQDVMSEQIEAHTEEQTLTESDSVMQSVNEEPASTLKSKEAILLKKELNLELVDGKILLNETQISAAADILAAKLKNESLLTCGTMIRNSPEIEIYG